MKQAIAIIGAGIGGLTTALLLKQKGYDITVYESAAAIQPVGAGIVMANNAMQIYKRAGIKDKIEAKGHKISVMKITDAQMKTLSAINLFAYESKYGVCNVAIHRADLQQMLAEETGYGNIKLSKRLSEIVYNENYILRFEDGSEVDCESVIAADGIKSIVRRQLFNAGEIRSAEQVCWRGVCEIQQSDKYLHEAIEMWGKGKRFGFVRISDTALYWYAVANKWLTKENDNNLSTLFSAFHSDILNIIASTPKEKIFQSDIIDLKPISIWAKANACLLGDAAHATTPNMGQGACQAVEDAYVLSQLLSSGKSIEAAFAAYEKLRIKKAHEIVNRSWMIGKLSHIENGLAIGIRNSLMKLTPSSANNKIMEKVFDISYIDG